MMNLGDLDLLAYPLTFKPEELCCTTFQSLTGAQASALSPSEIMMQSVASGISHVTASKLKLLLPATFANPLKICPSTRSRVSYIGISPYIYPLISLIGPVHDEDFAVDVVSCPYC